jgi:hypothetical protein
VITLFKLTVTGSVEEAVLLRLCLWTLDPVTGTLNANIGYEADGCHTITATTPGGNITFDVMISVQELGIGGNEAPGFLYGRTV